MVVVETITPTIMLAAISTAGVLATLPIGVVLLMRRVHNSVGLAPPTKEMLFDEIPEKECPLFRHLPNLSDKLAWRSLGVTSASPVHTCYIPLPTSLSGPPFKILVKREDLLSPLYGGNKIRTLQHQLAICEVRRDAGESAFRELVSLGTGGSNQIVATVVYGRQLGWGNDSMHINACWADKDEPDLDNTLNMLSVLSFPTVGWTHTWGDHVGMREFIGSIVGAWKQTDFVPMMPGGNCPSGVLGQISGMLELAEQIDAGQCADPRRIYLPVGSACTISGLIIGTVLARHLSMQAFSHPDFKIVGCNVQETLAWLDEKVRIHTHPAWSFMPLTISHTLTTACNALRSLGGPDLEEDAIEFMKNNVILKTDQKVVGKYGGHSDDTRAVANAYDKTGVIVDNTERKATPLWVCGHFVAKALTPMLHDLEQLRRERGEDKDTGNDDDGLYLLWQTKSAVQPRGEHDEWKAMLRQSNSVKKWANDGIAESILRPGHVFTEDGSANDYRSIMTKIS